MQANRNYLSPETCETVPCTAGFGVPSANNTSDPYQRTRLDGGSFEVLYRITNPVTSPVGIGLYFEPTFGRLEDELEYRLIVQSQLPRRPPRLRRQRARRTGEGEVCR